MSFHNGKDAVLLNHARGKMSETLTVQLKSRDQQGSDFDWLNISRGVSLIGKIRGLINGTTFIIYSINIFPEFERHGYAKKIVEKFKESFDVIIADRVRYTAIGFWVKMGFSDSGDGNYVYHKKKPI